MAGLIHIYCGDGKGKTSAAVGLAVRAAGRGRKVLVARFLKTDDSGEVEILKQIPGITVMPCDRTFGFIFRMKEEDKAEAAQYFTERFRRACAMAAEDGYDVLIIDEIMASCNYGMVPEAEVTAFLKTKPEEMEVVLTGRDPSDALLELADYVTEMKMQKHPFTRGIPAREGVEY
ncbi:MAG: cob(I)yrinic acid a,c-diamide adenosyltransferase [Brotaphodocola sp.]